MMGCKAGILKFMGTTGGHSRGSNVKFKNCLFRIYTRGSKGIIQAMRKTADGPKSEYG